MDRDCIIVHANRVATSRRRVATRDESVAFHDLNAHVLGRNVLVIPRWHIASLNEASRGGRGACHVLLDT